MAFVTFTQIPDEHYFLTLAKNMRAMTKNTNFDCMRLISFDGAHPRSYTSNDKDLLKTHRESQTKFFTRKVALESEMQEDGLVNFLFPERWEELKG